MNGFPDLQQTTKLLADQSRLEILTLLMDGKFHTVHEIAQAVKIKDHTASYHLKKLEALKWVTYYKQGRHVYYQLINPAIAELLESLMMISPIKTINSYNQNKEYQELKCGRTCYNHLAGALGVSFFDFLVAKNYLILANNQVELTHEGILFLNRIEIDTSEVKKRAGTFAKPCLDWTERTFHLSGNLAKAFLEMIIRKEYIYQSSDNRSVTLTRSGKHFFQQFS
ncbi:ArsR/SmtB family transcription factor [Candidatus Enterococcus lemimoniae]|uniref:HTH arsR-type domain-containing protein n=1 Tax=Candidatus Enterococcus lemimoniae TaxID=1834167 RepID=A0ABZ2T475_9ENTE|nr:metalloregulator ArsR/SmtB family transcription factor [Enterococcus sp. 12C11_DIV0727]OTO68561.1 hypothetical protein A5866_000759 [Enterococcus sp. 12C11_DIV0727]